MTLLRLLAHSLLLIVCALWCATPASSERVQRILPADLTLSVRPLDEVACFKTQSMDFERIRLEDVERESQGLPPRYAVPQEVLITPATAGSWEDLDNGLSLWRLRILAYRWVPRTGLYAVTW